jgi:hypothetical protein
MPRPAPFPRPPAGRPNVLSTRPEGPYTGFPILLRGIRLEPSARFACGFFDDDLIRVVEKTSFYFISNSYNDFHLFFGTSPKEEET